jgi:hypothetical protein
MPDSVTQNRRAAACASLMNVQNRLPAAATAVKDRADGRKSRLIRVQSLQLRDRAQILNSRLLYR